MPKSCAWLVAMIPYGLKFFFAIAELVSPKTMKVTMNCRKFAVSVSYSRKTGLLFDFKWESETIQEEHRES